jgi:hypothetical protein
MKFLYQNFLAQNLILIIKHIFTILKLLHFIYLNIKQILINRFLCILKVTEDFGTDPYPQPDPLVRGTDSEHWLLPVGRE